MWSDRWAGAYGQLSLRYLALHLSSSFLQDVLHNKCHCHTLCLRQISGTCAHSYMKRRPSARKDGGVSGASSSCGARGGFLPRHDEDLREPLVRRQRSQASMRVARQIATNLDSIFKSRDITFPTKVRLVKAMVFPVVTLSFRQT